MNDNKKPNEKKLKTHTFFNLNFKTFLASILVLSFAYLIIVFNKSISNSIERSFSFSTSTNNNNIDSEKKMAEGGNDWKSAQTIYEFKAPDINGNMVDLEKYK